MSGLRSPRAAAMAAVAAALLAPVTRAGAQPSPPGGGAITGVVFDSLTAAPLPGATVQLVAVGAGASLSRSVGTDSAGRYAIPDLPAGRYLVGFLHPALDSLGVQGLERTIDLRDGARATLDLATPLPARVHATICRAPDGSAPAGDGAVLVGVVRDARAGAPLAGASVSAAWADLAIVRDGGMTREPRRLVATTGPDGWFALCNVPRGGTLALQAARGADSTTAFDVTVPAAGFAHRVLYVGPASRPAVAPASLRGDGRLAGRVTAAGRPLPGALVRLVGGPETRTDDAGVWTLGDAPAGTRVLEVRAVGFFPDRRPVQVVPDARPVEVALETFQAVLDTMRIRAARTDRLNGFARHRERGGAGRVFDAADIARLNPTVTTDVLRSLAGLRVEADGAGEVRVTMRGVGERCAALIYIDDVYMGTAATAMDLDTWLQPGQLKGIEVYGTSSVPAQYRQSLESCGVVLLWTR